MNILPGTTPSEKELMQFAMSRPLAEKIRQAVAFLQGHETLAGDEGYYLAFSGGKDSVVMLRLAELAGVKFDAWYNQTTIDPPELVRFIREHHPDVAWNVPQQGNLIMHMANKSNGPPTRLARWCCEIYKEQGGTGRVKLIGVRAAESPRRAAQWRQVMTGKKGTTLCPILYWTDEDVWNFIRLSGIPYCSLYDEGFTRLGCVGCPMGGQKGQAREFARWPGFERLWKIGFKRWWSRWKGVPKKRDGQPRWFEHMDTWEDLWAWWTTAKRHEPSADCQTRLLFIGDAVDEE